MNSTRTGLAHADRNIHHDRDGSSVRDRIVHHDARPLASAALRVGDDQAEHALQRHQLEHARVRDRRLGKHGLDHGLQPWSSGRHMDRVHGFLSQSDPNDSAGFHPNSSSTRLVEDRPRDGRSSRPTEAEERRVRALRAAGKSFRRIEQEVGIGRRVIARIIRGEPTQAIGSHAKVTTPRIEARIISAYNKLRSTGVVASHFGVCAETARKVLKKNGIARRASDDMLRWPVHDGAFSEPLTEEAAYWIGFIGADGTIIRKPKLKQTAIQIGLASRDRAHLERFLAFVSPGRRVHDTTRATNGVRHSLSLATVPSDQLVLACARYGIVHGKTYSMPNFRPPLEQETAFWRGWFDGDGGICIYRGSDGLIRAVAHLIALPIVMECFRKWATRTTGRSAPNASVTKNAPQMRSIHFDGTHRPIEILRALYCDAAIYLPRKHTKWQQAETVLAERLTRRIRS